MLEVFAENKMTLVKVKGDNIVFINPGGCPRAAAQKINREIRDELPYCVSRLKARVKNGFLQIGKNARAGASHRWYAVYARKELQKRGLEI